MIIARVPVRDRVITMKGDDPESGWRFLKRDKIWC